MLTTIALITAGASLLNAHNSHKLTRAQLGDAYDDPHGIGTGGVVFLTLLGLGTAGAVYWVVRETPQA